MAPMPGTYRCSRPPRATTSGALDGLAEAVRPIRLGVVDHDIGAAGGVAAGRHTGQMRQGFAHEALLAMSPDADTRAPGAAVTLELCGHWEHEPPCPLAPHHSAVERIDDRVRLRVLFAAEASDESEIRQRIDRALSVGHVATPEGGSTQWQVVTSTPSTLLPVEIEHVQRLTQS